MTNEKREVYRKLITDEQERLEFDELMARIDAQRAQANKDKLTGYWMPLATFAPIIAALLVAIGYIFAKISN